MAMLFLCDVSAPLFFFLSLLSRKKKFTKKVNFFGSSFTTNNRTTTEKNKKKEKKRAQPPKKKTKLQHKIFYIRERERERERENEKTTTKKRKDEFDEIRPTNAFMGRKRSEVTLVRENSGLGRRGDERGSGEESHLGWNLATDDVRFAETDGGRERLGE